MRDDILEILAERRRPMTAGAVTMLVGRSAGGVLGADPDDEVAAALADLEAAGEIVSLQACPTCGLPGRVWTLPGELPAEAAPGIGLTPVETAETMSALIAEGSIEIGERVELVESGCCIRSARPWREVPRPS